MLHKAATPTLQGWGRSVRCWFWWSRPLQNCHEPHYFSFSSSLSWKEGKRIVVGCSQLTGCSTVLVSVCKRFIRSNFGEMQRCPQMLFQLKLPWQHGIQQTESVRTKLTSRCFHSCRKVLSSPSWQQLPIASWWLVLSTKANLSNISFPIP